MPNCPGDPIPVGDEQHMLAVGSNVYKTLGTAEIVY